MLQLAHVDPAGGAPLEDLVAGGIVGLVALAVLVAVTIAYRRGGMRPLRALAGFSERVSGMPAWAALPAAVAAGSLLLAVFGFYWDVSTHIDNGRDPGPFANPSHYFILFGLAGIALAGYLTALLTKPGDSASAVQFRGWTIPLGGLLILLCGVVALAGFPLDDVWHRLFGQDVTLWGPTHIQMVAGASLTTLGLWVLLTEAAPHEAGGRRPWLIRNRHVFVAGAFLLGLSTLQGEFDFAVPQFRLLYHPILIMLASSIGLVTARIKLGRFGALKAVAFFLVVRVVLTVLITLVLGRILFHFPLYLVEAVVVELVALWISPSRRLPFGLAAGAGIGTFGLASEWAWSHVWFPNPWPAELLPEGVIFGLLAAMAGGLVGALIGGSLSPQEKLDPIPRWAAVAAIGVAFLCIAYPAPMSTEPAPAAAVTLADIEGTGGDRTARVTVDLQPNDAAEGAIWFNALAWQGLDWDRGSSQLVGFEEVEPGTYRSEGPVPVGGGWKSLVRLHVDDRLLALPLYLPADPALSEPEVPALASFTRQFVPDKEIVQREAITSNVGLQRAAYAALAVMGLVWIATIGWALTKLGVGPTIGRRRRVEPRPGLGTSAG